MAISLLQHNTLYDTGSITQNLPLAFGSNVRPGSMIIVAINSFTSTVSSVTDNTVGDTNTYTQVTSSPKTNGTDNTYLFYAKNVSGGALTVTVNFNVASHVRSFGIYEYAGCDASAPFDKSAGNTGTSTSVDPGAFTPTINGSLIV